jgi:4-amino-4-deoxychorismate lyase
MYWYQGKSIASHTLELDINDPGLLYGATVFTTLRSVDRALVCQLHYHRLRSSIIELNWCQPHWEWVELGLQYLAAFFPVLRITIFPDGRELITGRELPPQLTTWQEQGIIVMIAANNQTRSLPHHKTGNYLVPWLALQQARNQDIQETILTNDRGDWLETSTGNLWGYGAGCWYTPPLSTGILPGIARSQIFNWLQQQRQPVIEIEWEVEWVKSLETIAYSNSVIHLIPIHTVITPVGTLRYSPHHPAMKCLLNSSV